MYIYRVPVLKYAESDKLRSKEPVADMRAANMTYGAAAPSQVLRSAAECLWEKEKADVGHVSLPVIVHQHRLAVCV